VRKQQQKDYICLVKIYWDLFLFFLTGGVYLYGGVRWWKLLRHPRRPHLFLPCSDQGEPILFLKTNPKFVSNVMDTGIVVGQDAFKKQTSKQKKTMGIFK